jgi:hypothetical protein
MRWATNHAMSDKKERLIAQKRQKHTIHTNTRSRNDTKTKNTHTRASSGARDIRRHHHKILLLYNDSIISITSLGVAFESFYWPLDVIHVISSIPQHCSLLRSKICTIIPLNRMHVQNFAGVIEIVSTPRVTFTLSFPHTYCRYFIESIRLFANLWKFKDKKRLQFLNHPRKTSTSCLIYSFNTILV